MQIIHKKEPKLEKIGVSTTITKIANAAVYVNIISSCKGLTV